MPDLTGPLCDLDTTRHVFAVLRQRLDANGIAMRAPPPEPDTCCGRGCNGCVWEGFYAAAAYWRNEALLHLSD
ncbi:oxidoreductase-like domain-containing protein [Piscinibacter gummiphilus]|uniref:Oxidoreductase n=1 Tax=Piscinibacter gummiphilus TaxID=946333 RepID=A0A1W6L509_9BURK|nr:oxidoreductase-like domain-containing protein [Piscinibacter gummiphilus]ARN19395.1 oxidoreductase [Piscinibacter gummiphilus]ATU64062.1 oxidoreductase [Piscinibacter gummiphilus]GLS92974.1 hypothetical protein GCM10007918_02650 [Piscinibacter gummiphilus]